MFICSCSCTFCYYFTKFFCIFFTLLTRNSVFFKSTPIFMKFLFNCWNIPRLFQRLWRIFVTSSSETFSRISFISETFYCLLKLLLKFLMQLVKKVVRLVVRSAITSRRRFVICGYSRLGATPGHEVLRF